MGNEKKIIEDLIGSLFDQNNVDENVIAEETNLILSYLNGTLDKKQIKEFQNRIKTDDDFRFRFQFVNYKRSVGLPKYRLKKLLSYLINVLSFTSESKEETFSREFIPASAIHNKTGTNYLSLKYLIPITVTFSIFFALFILPDQYEFQQLSSKMIVYTTNTWRGGNLSEEPKLYTLYSDYDAIDSDYDAIGDQHDPFPSDADSIVEDFSDDTLKYETYTEIIEIDNVLLYPTISYDNNALSIEWNKSNPIVDRIEIIVNQQTYDTKEENVMIDNYIFTSDTLRLDIIEYGNDLPIAKFAFRYLVSN